MQLGVGVYFVKNKMGVFDANNFHFGSLRQKGKYICSVYFMVMVVVVVVARVCCYWEIVEGGQRVHEINVELCINEIKNLLEPRQFSKWMNIFGILNEFADSIFLQNEMTLKTHAHIQAHLTHFHRLYKKRLLCLCAPCCTLFLLPIQKQFILTRQ